MARIAALLSISLSLIGVSVACAGSPSAYDHSAPEWVIEPPRGDARYEYFVAAGSSPAGDAAEAERRASEALIDEIVRYLGVQVTSRTTATARASLEQFETEVERRITQRADARLAGFRITDRFLHERGEAVTVYILGSYERSALTAERDRLQALFQEREEALAEPERQARRLELEGEYYAAIARYLEAAQMAVGSAADIAELRAERNLNEARRLVSAVRLVKRTDEIQTMVRTPFAEPFELAATVDGRPMPGARVRVVYQDARADGRPGMRSFVATADEEGIVRFHHPTPQTVGTRTVSMSLELEPYLSAAEQLEQRFQPLIDGLRRTAVESQAVFRYHVSSRARSIPTGVAFLDTDIAGNATGSTSTRAGILDALSRAEFQVRPVSLESELLLGGDHDALLRAARDRYDDRFRRIVVGHAQIDELIEEDGAIVRVSGTVTVLDLENGEVLYSDAATQRSRANAPQAAISAAFRALGERFGVQLASTLP